VTVLLALAGCGGGGAEPSLDGPEFIDLTMNGARHTLTDLYRTILPGSPGGLRLAGRYAVFDSALVYSPQLSLGSFHGVGTYPLGASGVAPFDEFDIYAMNSSLSTMTLYAGVPGHYGSATITACRRSDSTVTGSFESLQARVDSPAVTLLIHGEFRVHLWLTPGIAMPC
jgi:hypothetical protein